MRDKSMTTINALDPIEHLRSRRKMYLPDSGSIPLFLAQRLSNDAMIVGAHSVHLAHDGDWWTVSADFDWLADKSRTVQDLFSGLIPFPEAGVNSIRSEVLLTAFAQDVVTIDASGNQVVVKGETPPRSGGNFDTSRPWARIVRFRL
jgi:hypothetical protein